VRIWEDAWIPSLDGFRLKNKPPDYDCTDFLVSDLIKDGGWCLNSIEPWITIDELEAILRIPLPRVSRSDKMVWAHCKDGKYTVRSGYKCCKVASSKPDTLASVSVPLPNGIWKAIWNLNVPPKVKHFIWRCCSAAIPTRENLFKRKCASNALCPCCCAHCETIEHLLFFCDWARRAWFCCPFSVRIDPVGFQSFERWCWRWLSEDKEVDEFTKSFLAIMCWEIWKERCQVVFQKVAANPVLVGVRAQNLHSDFWRCLQPSLSEDVGAVPEVPTSGLCWVPPPTGVLKFNTDGSFLNTNFVAGFGIVVRDCFGRLVDGRAAAAKAHSPFAIEAIALSKACDMAVALSLDVCIFETDCRDLVLAVENNSFAAHWSCDALLSDISSFFSSHPRCVLKLVPRQANMAADCIAKLAARKMCPLGWVATPPSSLASILSADCSSFGAVDAVDAVVASGMGRMGVG